MSISSGALSAQGGDALARTVSEVGTTNQRSGGVRMQAQLFKVGDKAVHPAHGVGVVTGIESREIAGSKGSFYVLQILESGMKVMVPTGAADAVGLRTVMSKREADQVLEVFRVREKAVGGGPWNRRQRAYNEMIKSGSPYEVAKVLRDLYAIKFKSEKDLSYGERRLMDQAKSLLVKELALAKRVTEAAVEKEIEDMFTAPTAAAG
jgi:CarD family transcriptional regulator